MKRHTFGCIAFLCAMGLNSGCVPQGHSPTPTPSTVTGDGDLISDRPIQRDREILLLKLNQPALLTSAQTIDGVTVVDEELKAAILAEQEQVLNQIQGLSSDIQVLFRYRLVLNGLAVAAPVEFVSQLQDLPSVTVAETSRAFARPAFEQTLNVTLETLAERNSVRFINSHRVHEDLGFDGSGTSVGVIDTGIDYTHTMFGGTGTAEAYQAIDPDQTNESFPNAKVVGGIDLVGTHYNPSSPVFSERLPKVDANPIDEAGHGTHVAGTVAGIGDGVETYSGVAPGATLHAIKVFGAAGPTNDYVVIAGLEYAADPNSDLDPADQLDVVNLSLGGGYGKPTILYGEAIANLVAAGTITVAAAGNSGAVDNIVGAPSTVSEAISVAASIDDAFHNWKFNAVSFRSKNHEDLLVEAVEAAISKPIEEAGAVQGALVYIGLGDKPLDEATKAKLSGKVALIDRGVVSFSDKLKLAVEGGAIGAVVANNEPGNPIVMGGEGSFDIPAIMVSLEIGDVLKKEMEAGSVEIQFSTGRVIERPELIDTLTDFSSKGPRSIDSLIKPEISAPGFKIISAAMGQGNKGVALNGTSMAAPHMAGVMALLRQARPDLNADQLKSLALASTVTLDDAEQKTYPVSQQGTGRVDAFKAVTQSVIVSPAALSLGELVVEKQKALRRSVTLKNTSDQPVSLTLKPELGPGLSVRSPGTVQLAAQEQQSIDLDILISSPQGETSYAEMDGRMLLLDEGKEVGRIAMLAVVSRISRVRAENLVVQATSPADDAGAIAELNLINDSAHPGEALIFNLLARDRRKLLPEGNKAHLSRECDLESAGVRVVNREEDGEKRQLLQVAFKLFNPVTNWQHCQLSVQIDADGDGQADQELAGTQVGALSGLAGETYASLLLNATKAREIRLAYELAVAESPDTSRDLLPDYTEAVVAARGMKVYNHSTIAVIEADLDQLAITNRGRLAVKVAVLNEEGENVEMDDYLDQQLREWKLINPTEKGMAYYGMPEAVTVEAHQTQSVSLTKGDGRQPVIVFLPQNAFTTSPIESDEQSSVAKPEYSNSGQRLSNL